jgi:cellulase/cellobiase CelA1
VVVGTTAAACKITYTLVNQWNTGFQGGVKITNLGPPINGWTLTWTFLNGQTITQLWNGPFTQTGSSVVTHDAGWNANLASGGTADVGFIANWSGSNAAPTGFTLNGAVCSVGP